MTNEEAIKILKSKMNGSVDTSYEWVETVQMAIKALKQPEREYTESEMKILKLMFRIIEEIIKMQNGYMDIDYVSFDGGDLYNLAEKLGVAYY